MKKLILTLLIVIVTIICYNQYQMRTDASSQISQFYEQHHNLVLVNKDHKSNVDPTNIVPLDATKFDNVKIQDVFYVSEQMVNPLIEMFKAAKEDSINHFIINSAYRSHDEQARIYSEKGSDYALPAGYSEHETGLAIDIGSTNGLVKDSVEGKWLAKHAHQFGFILRYPEEKEEITKIEFEPWHFRYVGLPHSIIMNEKNMVLEEYIAWLKDKREVVKKVNGIKYTITYFDDASLAQVALNSKMVSSVTLNDAFIVTQMK